MKDKVRMNISREMHNWFKSIEGKTNDERMKRVIEVNDDYVVKLSENYRLERAIELRDEYRRESLRRIQVLRSNNRILKQLLALSTAVSIVSVSCLAYVQGWFL